MGVGAPSGTVTFLFTDIEGSTALWQAAPEAMRAALERHDSILRSTIDGYEGYVFSTGGDGFGAAFGRTGNALAAAAAAQEALAAEAWPPGAPIRVRIGLHTGEVEERDGDYFGTAVNRTARIMAAGHGGQVLVSAATATVAGGTGLADLGEHTFAGLAIPERVYQLGSGEFPPLRSVGAVPSNLPAERSVFVGRDRELGVVAGLVRSARVVTLTGVGGVGKTRLAVQTAAGMVGEFSDGVWLVELAPLIDAALVATTVASSVGAPASLGVESAEVVCRFLAPKRALVVLDNCEHVIDAAATLVDLLVGAAPRVRVLATSREPLDVAGESVWRVPSLTVDTFGQAGDAVALFVERATQARPGFVLDDINRAAVVQVCRRLDGIPLAIELAAARAKVMSVEQIATRLDERFRLLTRGGRTAVPRQQTLQGAIDWSYELLASEERELFDVLGVFAGEFDLAAAAAVSNIDEFEVLDLVGQLTDKSMLEADPVRDRYRLLETLRQYAWDRLISTDRLTDTRDAHAAYYATLAGEQAGLMGVAGRQVGALDRLEVDYDNLRAALAHLIEEHQADAAVRMVRRLIGLFNIRHPREGFGWFRQVIAIADGLPAKTRSRLLGDAAHSAMTSGDLPAQGEYASLAIDVGGVDAPAAAHFILSQWHVSNSDFPQAAEQARQGIAVAAATGDATIKVTAAGALVTSLAALGLEDDTREEIADLIQSAEALGNPTITASSYLVSGGALALLGCHDEAIALFERGLAHADAGGPHVESTLRVEYALEVDDADRIALLVRVAIPIAKEALAGYQQLMCLLPAAKLMVKTGRAELAGQFLGAYRRQAQHSRANISPFVAQWDDRLLNQLASLLGRAVLDDAFERGAQLTADEALDLALDSIGEAV